MNFLRWKPLSRRTILRGAFRGAALSVGLPILEAMQPRRASAQAARPRRFLGVFVPVGFSSTRADTEHTWNGPDKWTPQNTGKNWVMTPLLKPFEDVRDDISILTNLNFHAGGAHEGHASVLCAHDFIQTGGGMHAAAGGGRSVDQAMADQIGTGTKFKSLEVGAMAIGAYNQGYSMMISYTGARAGIRPQDNPMMVYSRLFADLSNGAGGSGGTQPDPAAQRLLAERRSVIDSVAANLALYKKRLGTRDGLRLDEHLSQIRAIERRVMSISGMTSGPGCRQPAQSSLGYRDETLTDKIVDVQRDFIMMALVCDLSRVITFVFGGSHYTGAYRHLPAPTWSTWSSYERHGMTHSCGGGADPRKECPVAMFETDMYNNKVMADFVRALKQTADGAGSLLDSTVMLGMTEVASGGGHNGGGSIWRGTTRTGRPTDSAWLIAGLPAAKGGVFQHGSHLRYKDGQTDQRQLQLALYEAVTGQSGAAARAWMPAGYSAAPLPGLRGDATTALMDFPNPV